jgi:Holliday junction resolvase
MESGIQAKIIKYLESEGVYVRKVTITNRNGTPDLLCCRDGEFIAFEVKKNEKAKKEAGELQIWNQKKIQKAGGKAFIVASLDEVKEIINGLKSVESTRKNNKQNYYELNECSIRS